jgi:hypothetical protein
MNGEARCSVSGPAKYALRQGFRQKYVSTEEAVDEGRHQQTAPTHDIRGSESTVME